MDIQHTLDGLFNERVKQYYQQVAVICKGQSLSYQHLNEQSNQLAHYLMHMGAMPDKPVAICMERSLDLLIVIMGILKAGSAYLPLDPKHPSDRLNYILNDNHHPIIITTSELKTQFLDYPGLMIILDEAHEELHKQSIHNPPPQSGPNHLAYIIYTSGSTGRPKGTLIEHHSVFNYCQWFRDYTNCLPGQRIDFSANYIFDMSITCSIAALLNGLSIVICTDEIKKDQREYLRYLNENQIHLIKITPSYLKLLLHDIANTPYPLPALKTIILGGENLQTMDCQAWLRQYPDHTLFNEYGPTEATVAVSQFKVTSQSVNTLGASVPIGKPGPGMHCYLLDEQQKPIPIGQMGELYISGPCLARGYLNQPDLTHEKFIKNPLRSVDSSPIEAIDHVLYKTGDLCKVLPNGIIEYIDRIDHQLKIRGYRIEPQEIEHHLVSHPSIKDAVVLTQKDKHNEKLIAYYILKEDHPLPAVNQIQSYLMDRLPHYMIPAAFVRIESLPLTPNGKLDRKALPIPRFTINQHYSAPSTALEKSIADIWSKELGLDLIGVEDNFFELGGHSLSAARIISEINATLNKEITLSAFYKAETIKKLLPIIYHARKATELTQSCVKSTESSDALFPLSDFQCLLWLSNAFEPKAKKMNILLRKRFLGQPDRQALEFAFNCVLKKHEVFVYQVLKLQPAQRLQKNIDIDLTDYSLNTFSEDETERKLEQSMNQLRRYCSWPKGSPLLKARIYYLKNNEAELQVCMPHIISDDLTPHILLSDLSRYYLSYGAKNNLDEISIDHRYREYQQHEYLFSQERQAKDKLFWEKYFHDTVLFSFPNSQVIHRMSKQKLPYSTYTELSEDSLSYLQALCARNHVSINDGLCAVLSMALLQCSDDFKTGTQHVFMNIVKSTRGNSSYDHTIGCFLKLEPIKVALNKQANLIDLAKQIHRAAVQTAPYQQCASLIKLSSIGALLKNTNRIKKKIIKSIIYLYTKLIPTPQIDSQTLALCEHLIASKKTNEFIININVHRHFIPEVNTIPTESWFGFKEKKVKTKPYDLIMIDRFFDVCFIRDDYDMKPYIVISANLRPAFRECLAETMIHIMSTQIPDAKPQDHANIERLVTI